MLYVKYTVLLYVVNAWVKGIEAKVRYGIQHRDPDTDCLQLTRFGMDTGNGTTKLHQSDRSSRMKARRMNVRVAGGHLRKLNGCDAASGTVPNSEFNQRKLTERRNMHTGYDHYFDGVDKLEDNIGNVVQVGPENENGREALFPLHGDDLSSPLTLEGKNPIFNTPSSSSTNPASSPNSSGYLAQVLVKSGGDNPATSPTPGVSLFHGQVMSAGTLDDDDVETATHNDVFSVNYVDDDDGFLVLSPGPSLSNDPFVDAHSERPDGYHSL